jgi:hypothetical protein
VRRFALILAALLACAHAPPPPETAADEPAERGRLDLADGQTPPVRKSCRRRGPKLPEGETVSGAIEASYLVGADGKVADVTVTGKASAAALKAIKSYIAGCTYAPATRDGKPVAVRWQGELNFTRAPASR